MLVQFLISTTNRSDLNFAKRMFQHFDMHNIHAIIINQCFNIEPVDIQNPYPNIQIISIKDRGLSKSRNMAIRAATAQICVIADDDVVYLPDAIENIKTVHTKKPDTALIITKIQQPNGQPYSNYGSTPGYFSSPLQLMAISSIEMSFKLKMIHEQHILFNENLGLGTSHPGGEESFFTGDCAKKGLKLWFEPVFTVVHPAESSGRTINPANIEVAGLVFARFYPTLHWVWYIYFAITKYTRYKNICSVVEYLNILHRGKQLLKHI